MSYQDETYPIFTVKVRNRIERTSSKRWRGSVRRVISAAIYNLSCFTHGCSTGWVSGVLGVEALAGGAWLAALPCLVALPAAPFFAVLADAKGRKAGAFCISVSFIISWSLAAWCGTRGVWAARVAAGAGGAGALALSPLYCAEIAPRTRGLAAMPALACSCGILFAYTAGPLLSAHALSLSMAVPPAVLMVSLLWLPETPSFLISIGRVQDAARVMCWFNGSDFREDLTDVIEQQEVRIRTNDCYGNQHRREGLRRQDSDAFQPMLKRSSGLESSYDQKNDTSACRELLCHRRSRHALASCCVLIFVAAGSGSGAVSSFAAGVLRQSGHITPSLALNITAYKLIINNGTVPRALFETSEAGSMLCGTALVLGAAVATLTVDKLGRKILLILSCLGIACCLTVLGIYCDPRLHLYSWSHSHQQLPYFNRIKNQQNILNASTKSSSDIFVQNQLDNNYTRLSEVARLRIVPENITYVRESEKRSKDMESLPRNMRDWHQRDRETMWPPVVLLSMVLFLYNIGLGSVPLILVSEFFSISVRSLASSLLISWMWLSSFVLLRYFAALTVALGLHGTYYLCASITLLGSVYTFVVIPETKGKSQEQINEALDRPLFSCFRRRGKRGEGP